MKQSISESLKNFFNENEFHRIAKKIAISRFDGIVIYSNCLDQMESASIGALVAGVWQAAQSLSNMVDETEKASSYRFSFDTTSQGIYILPLSLAKNNYYLSAIFKDEINPAKLKQNMRSLGFMLEEYFKNFEGQKANRDGYLFDNISDEEIEKLFRVSENKNVFC